MKLLFSFLLVMVLTTADAQEFLQLEVLNSTKTIKYAPGDRLVYKTKQFPDDWQKYRIQYFIYSDSLIMFEHGLENMNDIIAVREFKPFPFSLAKGLYTFSTVALVFGTIDLIYQGRNPDLVDAGFIILPTMLGLFLDKVVAFHKYKIGKNARLRLLDLRL